MPSSDHEDEERGKGGEMDVSVEPLLAIKGDRARTIFFDKSADLVFAIVVAVELLLLPLLLLLL